MDYFKLFLEELKALKWLQNWTGVKAVLKELFQRFLKFVGYFFYFFIIFFTKLFIDIYTYIKKFTLFCWEWLAKTVSKFPKAFIILFILINFFTIFYFKVEQKVQEQNFSKRYDKVLLYADSIKDNSTWDSGFTAGLREGNRIVIEAREENKLREVLYNKKDTSNIKKEVIKQPKTKEIIKKETPKQVVVDDSVK